MIFRVGFNSCGLLSIPLKGKSGLSLANVVKLPRLYSAFCRQRWQSSKEKDFRRLVRNLGKNHGKSTIISAPFFSVALGDRDHAPPRRRVR